MIGWILGNRDEDVEEIERVPGVLSVRSNLTTKRRQIEVERPRRPLRLRVAYAACALDPPSRLQPLAKPVREEQTMRTAR
jgi:hypothetical protein